MTPLEVPTWLLELYPPSRLGLLEHLIPRTDGEMLKHIAHADYGMDYAEHLVGLHQICDRRDVPNPLGFDPPREVLELCRWSEPGRAGLEHWSEERFHVMRTFACGTLLLINTEGSVAADNNPDESTIIQLVESVGHLGELAVGFTCCFFVWRLLHEREYDKEYFARGLLILMLLHGNSRMNDVHVESLCQFVLGHDLLNMDFGQKHEKWYRMLKAAADLHGCDALKTIVSQVKELD